MTDTTTEQDWRKAIAEQVRRNCTPSSEAYAAGGDTLIRAVADWIENPPEWSTIEAPTRETTTQPVKLTADDFEMQWDADRKFPFVETEDATILAYGHPDTAELAAQITEYDRICAGPFTTDGWETAPGDIRQAYAVVTEGGPGDEWRIRWNADATDEAAFPVSVVTR